MLQNGIKKAKDTPSCAGCGAGLPLKMKKTGKASSAEGHFYCTPCAKVGRKFLTFCIFRTIILTKLIIFVMAFCLNVSV